MRLHDHFLPEDLEQASREHWCAKELLDRISLLTDVGEIEKAKHLSIDLTRSLHELSRLSDKKKEMDKVKRLFEQMNMNGINVQVIRRIGNARRDEV